VIVTVVCVIVTVACVVPADRPIRPVELADVDVRLTPIGRVLEHLVILGGIGVSGHRLSEPGGVGRPPLRGVFVEPRRVVVAVEHGREREVVSQMLAVSLGRPTHRTRISHRVAGYGRER
jgi:hypothetical protein